MNKNTSEIILAINAHKNSTLIAPELKTLQFVGADQRQHLHRASLLTRLTSMLMHCGLGANYFGVGGGLLHMPLFVAVLGFNT